MEDDSSGGIAASDVEEPDALAQSAQFALVLSLRPDQAVLPPECACCGALPSRTLSEARFDGRRVLVPYCADCHAHASRDRTRLFGTTLSTALVTATVAAGLPLIVQPPSALVYVLVVAVASLVPPLVSRFARGRARAPHAALGRAVFFTNGGALVCVNPGFGARVAAASGAEGEIRPAREPLVSRFLPLVVGLILALCPLAYRLHFPEVRIVNLTDTRLTVEVDGKARASVPPTSSESPNAGVIVRIPSGVRALRARKDTGEVVDTATVVVKSGEPHLYAPGSTGTCFWVETRGYGRSRDASVPDEPLSGEPHFWALGEGVDFWFTSPPTTATDERSSGGLLRALRQAPCDAPR